MPDGLFQISDFFLDALALRCFGYEFKQGCVPLTACGGSVVQRIMVVAQNLVCGVQLGVEAFKFVERQTVEGLCLRDCCF